MCCVRNGVSDRVGCSDYHGFEAHAYPDDESRDGH